MNRNELAGNLCGLFAIISVLSGTWLVGSTLWEYRDPILQGVKDHPAWTIFLTAFVGFAFSFAWGARQ